MKPFFVLLLVLAVAVGAVILLQQAGKDDGTSDLPTVPDDNGTGAEDGTKGDGKKKDSATLAGTTTEGPAKKPEAAVLKTPAAVLLIGRNDVTWTASLRQAFAAMKDLSYANWFLESVGPDGKVSGPVAGPGRGLPELTAQPTANYIEENDIRALFFDTADPNAFPMAFWETVARRVKSGRMGLYVRPSAPSGTPPWSVHPVLSHPVLKELMPIAKAQAVTGTPPPGLYTLQAQSLTVTSDGVRHPATRLVAEEDDSRDAWAATRVGEGAYVTKFVYPVQEQKSDALVLVELDNGDYPALIVSGGNARVLWQGNVDFGTRAEYVHGKKVFQTTLMSHWILWLVGQAE